MEEELIKLETHAHCLGGSGCASVPIDALCNEYKAAGYGGIVLTNHYCESCFSGYKGDNDKEKKDFYFSLVKEFEKQAEKVGLKHFYGAEVRAVSPENTYMEYMLYGFDEKFIYDNILLFTLTQEELFKLADKNGVFMYQTHPFRRGVTTGNPKFLHGAEAFNGHVNHINYNEQATKFCIDNSLIKMSGTDYHDFGQPIDAGIYIPSSINTNKELCDYIVSGKAKLICDAEKYQKNLRAKL